MQYPLGEHEREQIASKTGKKLDEITLDAVIVTVFPASTSTL